MKTPSEVDEAPVNDDGDSVLPNERTASVVADDDLLTVKEVETKSRFSHTTVYALIKARKLDAIKVGRATRITGKSYRRLIANSPKV